MKGADKMSAKKNPHSDAQYEEMTKKNSPASPLFKDCVMAFIFGGLICLGGEGLYNAYLALGIKEETVRPLVSVTIIVLTAILTGLGVFDKIAKVAGAGTLVPITGFANSVVAPAIEYTTEGRILGTAVKMFTIAGPVIVYGCGTAVVYGFFYYFFGGAAGA